MASSLAVLFRNSSKILAGMTSVAAIQFLQGILVARYLGPSGYGEFGILIALCATVKGFLGFRTQEPLTKSLVELQHQGETSKVRSLITATLLTDFATGLAGFVIISAAFPLVAHLFGSRPSMGLACALLALVPLLECVSPTFFAMCRNFGGFGPQAYHPLALALIQFVAIATFALAGTLDLDMLAVAYMGSTLLVTSLQWILLARGLRARYGFSLFPIYWRDLRESPTMFPEFWRFMGSSYLATMASSLFKSADTLILGHFSDQATLGYYRMARNLSSVVQTSGQSLSYVIYQDLNEMRYSASARALRNHLGRLMKIWVPFVLALVGSAIALSGSLIPLFFGDGYRAAVPPFRILVLGMGVAMALCWVQPLLLSRGLHLLYLKIMVVSSVCAIALMFLLGSWWGLTGVAGAYSGMWALVHLACLGGMATGWRRDMGAVPPGLPNGANAKVTST